MCVAPDELNLRVAQEKSLMYANAGLLFRSAVELQRGVSSLNASSEQAQRECLASVIFTAMSTEAFVNELPELAADAAKNPAEPGWVKALGEVLADAEDSRASIKSKYQLASLVLTGKVFDKGAQPFQDFALLVDVRNLVVHWKPREAVRRKEADGALTSETEIMSRLEQRGAIKTAGDFLPKSVRHGESVTIGSDLLAEISVQSMGVWACGAAAAMVNAVLDAIPASPRFAFLVQTIYRKDFQTSADG